MMNPFRWQREHQVAMGIAAAIGAILGIMAAYSLGYREAAQTTTPFRWWWYHSLLDSWGWILFGALIGAGCVYVRQLLRTPN